MATFVEDYIYRIIHGGRAPPDNGVPDPWPQAHEPLIRQAADQFAGVPDPLIQSQSSIDDFGQQSSTTGIKGSDFFPHPQDFPDAQSYRLAEDAYIANHFDFSNVVTFELPPPVYNDPGFLSGMGQNSPDDSGGD